MDDISIPNCIAANGALELDVDADAVKRVPCVSVPRGCGDPAHVEMNVGEVRQVPADHFDAGTVRGDQPGPRLPGNRRARVAAAGLQIEGLDSAFAHQLD